MSNKNILNKDKKIALKEEIESLLNLDSNTKISDELNNNQDELKSTISDLANDTVSLINFDEMESKFKIKSNELLTSLFNFYIDLGVINNDDYFKYKKRLDEESMNDIEFQLETIKICIKKAMEEITSGNTHPRLLEVMSAMQGQLTNVIKTKANYLLFLEDSYKKLKLDYQEKNNQEEYTTNTHNIDSMSTPTEILKNEYYVGVGTRNLIKQINEEIPIEKIKELNKDKESYALTNPNMKSELMKTLNISDDMIRTNNTDDTTQNNITSSDINEIL